MTCPASNSSSPSSLSKCGAGPAGPASDPKVNAAVAAAAPPQLVRPFATPQLQRSAPRSAFEPCNPTPPASPPCLQETGTMTGTSWSSAPGSVTTTTSSATFSSRYSTRQDYMASLVPPSREEFEKISHVQQEREAEIRERRARQKSLLRSQPQQLQQLQHRQGHHSHNDVSGDVSEALESQGSSHDEGRKSLDAFRLHRAAKVIQRTYRGYRSRRELQGLGLDPSTRWVAAIQEAQFRETTRPRARSGLTAATAEGESMSILSRESDGAIHRGFTARENWRKAAIIALRAGHDDACTDSSPSLSPCSSEESGDSPEKQARRRRERHDAVTERKEHAMTLGLQYFLEMVDLKHRYGSNLQVYHEEWKREETNENFFYWLDQGAGRGLEMAACPRDRLEREQVRYLSREERQYYLVTVDGNGRLCWAKNGAHIDTTEQYKDSVHGIVPSDDPTPSWRRTDDRPMTRGGDHADAHDEPDADDEDDDGRSESSIESARESDRAAKYATTEFDNAKGPRKVMHLSASTVFNKLLRKSVRKNTWIFVADTNYRLYVGIKASGAFQHSSFLQGGRISAAGLIKIKDGRLTSLSPLSGHYRPPASNFRAFMRSLRDAGVDVSHASISKSYVVLVGLEAYVKTRKKGRDALKRITNKKEKMVAPEKVARREEEEKDKSESAERERQILEKQKAVEEREREENKTSVKLMKKLHIGHHDSMGPRRSSEGVRNRGLDPERADESPKGTVEAETRGQPWR